MSRFPRYPMLALVAGLAVAGCARDPMGPTGGQHEAFPPFVHHPGEPKDGDPGLPVCPDAVTSQAQIPQCRPAL